MFKYYKELGLESEPLNTNDLVDLELDIFGCESAADLTLSVLEYTLDNEIAALGFNKVLIAETVAGIEGVDFTEILTELGIEGITNTVDSVWTKFKLLVKRIVNAVLMFLNKFKAVFVVNEKLYKKIQQTADELIKQHRSVCKYGNIKYKKEKVDSAIINLNEGVVKLYYDITGVFKALLISDSNTLKDIKTLDDFIKNINKLDIQQHGSKFPEDVTGKDKKQLKNEYANIYKKTIEVYSKKKEIKSNVFMRKSINALEDISINTGLIIDWKYFEKIDESIKVITNIKKQIDSLSDSDTEKYFGKDTKLKETVIKLATSINSKYSNLLVIEIEGAKAYAEMCNLVFKETKELFKLVESK